MSKATEKRPPMGGGHGPGRGVPVTGAKAKDFKGSMGRLLKYIGKYKIAVIVVFVFAIASAVFSIIGPKLMGNATTVLFNGVMGQISGSGEGFDFAEIARILIMLVILYGLSALFSYVQGFIMTGVSNKVTYRLRQDISRKINTLPLSYFDRNSHGDVLSRVTNDVDTISQTLNQSLSQIVTSITMVVGVAVMMFTINWIMTLVALVMVPVSMALVAVVVRLSQKHFVAQQRLLGALNGRVEETFSGHAVVRAFGREDETVRAYEADNEALYNAGWKAQFLSGLMMPVLGFVGNLGYVAVAVTGAFFAVAGTITVGDIQAFVQYVKNFTQPITQLSQVGNVLQQMAAAAERIFAFLEEPELEAEKPTAKAADVDCDVEFDHVRFGYDPDKPVIGDFSAKVRQGRTVALVGPTGAGKTTMVKLLMRFYDVDAGAIRLGGTDIREFSRTDVRNQFGMVLQDTWLFNGTVRDNIAYGKLDATDAEVEAAARAAYVHHFITTLPHGYDTVINEDASNISAGQRQLLTIARAILADRRMLILDEATSSVDTRTEERIQKAMDNLMEGRTSFVIAHRLTTNKNTDLICVLQHGDIVEQGTHEELLSLGGAYAELYNSQFEEDGVEDE